MFFTHSFYYGSITGQSGANFSIKNFHDRCGRRYPHSIIRYLEEYALRRGAARVLPFDPMNGLPQSVGAEWGHSI